MPRVIATTIASPKRERKLILAIFLPKKIFKIDFGGCFQLPKVKIYFLKISDLCIDF
jgi:hypothetical protein